jgi:hypothetical protein
MTTEQKNSPCSNKESVEINLKLYGKNFNATVDRISHKEHPEIKDTVDLKNPDKDF